MNRQVRHTIIDLVPMAIGAGGVRVYGSERDAATFEACCFLLDHPHETIGILAVAVTAVVCCCLASDSNPARRQHASKKKNRALRHGR
jgi:hypothetical protein